MLNSEIVTANSKKKKEERKEYNINEITYSNVEHHESSL